MRGPQLRVGSSASVAILKTVPNATQAKSHVSQMEPCVLLVFVLDLYRDFTCSSLIHASKLTYDVFWVNWMVAS